MSLDDAQMRELLAPLNRVEPVTLLPRRANRRHVLIVGLLATLLLATGVAIAAGLDPFTGIRTASHAQQPQDILPPAVITQLGSFNDPNSIVSQGGLVTDSSRLLGRLTSGHEIYVVKTTKHNLCVLVTNHGRLSVVSCGNPLTQSEPVTVTSFGLVKSGPNATPPLSYGIARDGVTAVSFKAHGREHAVPVKNNVWFYEGNSNVLASITIHYANGRTQTLTH
jgi:hypothetical protein